jgi:hypothetical protein
MTAMARQPLRPERSRALVLMASGAWRGWFCEGCSWKYPLPPDENERTQLARRIKQLFDQHSCREISQAEPRASFGDPME